jgi:S-adenosylmethionine-diacylglycerol 3-amino-3-carboxypropyl transferase
MPLGQWLSEQCFQLVHRHNLVYNTCWEDPRLDRIALELKPDDVVMVITSAGCNALDNVLAGAKHVHAVDMNPRQNALLELKLAGLRGLEQPDFFAMFGQGVLPTPERTYRTRLRPHLSPPARQYWDRHLGFFSPGGWRRSFYFRGTAGTFARMANLYIDKVAKVRPQVTALFQARTLTEQQNIYQEQVRPVFWRRFLRWAMRRDTTLSLLGVPRPQRLQVERHYPGGIARFVEDSLEAVCTRLPLADNYFWRVYLEGSYTPDCCPEYLKPANFVRLQTLTDRISVHTDTVQRFLRRHPGRISRFVLLDHMDWLSTHRLDLLREEWQAILDRAAPNTRILWRSGGLKVDYVAPLEVNVRGRLRRVGDLLHYHHDLAARLHPQDRVHTYGSFYIADLKEMENEK